MTNFWFLSSARIYALKGLFELENHERVGWKFMVGIIRRTNFQNYC